MFEGNLSKVTIEETKDGKTTTTTMNDAVLIAITKLDGKNAFALREKTPVEKENEANANEITSVQEAIIYLYEMLQG